MAQMLRTIFSSGLLCPSFDNAASNTSRLKKTSNLFYEFLLLIQLDWRDANKEKADWKPDSKKFDGKAANLSGIAIVTKQNRAEVLCKTRSLIPTQINLSQILYLELYKIDRFNGSDRHYSNRANAWF